MGSNPRWVSGARVRPVDSLQRALFSAADKFRFVTKDTEEPPRANPPPRALPFFHPVAQTFQSAASRNFPVPCARGDWKVPTTRRLESLCYRIVKLARAESTGFLAISC